MCRETDRQQVGLSAQGCEVPDPKTRFDFEAVRTAIGTALRTYYSEVPREPISDRMAELLRQLVQSSEGGQDTDRLI